MIYTFLLGISPEYPLVNFRPDGLIFTNIEGDIYYLIKQ